MPTSIVLTSRWSSECGAPRRWQGEHRRRRRADSDPRHTWRVDGDELRSANGLTVGADGLSWSFTRSTGAGGQHVNKASTRATLDVDLGWLEGPSATVERVRRVLGGALRVSSQGTRSQWRNRQECLFAEPRNSLTKRPRRRCSGGRRSRPAARRATTRGEAPRQRQEARPPIDRVVGQAPRARSVSSKRDRCVGRAARRRRRGARRRRRRTGGTASRGPRCPSPVSSASAVGEVVDPDVGVGVERPAVVGGVDRVAHRFEVVADDEERAAGGNRVEEVVDAAAVGCAGDRRVLGRDEVERRASRRRRARWRRRGGTRSVRPRVARPRSSMRSSARWEMSLAVTVQPCSASQTASPPSPAPTSSARPGARPSISLTSVPFGLPLQIWSPP